MANTNSNKGSSLISLISTMLQKYSAEFFFARVSMHVVAENSVTLCL